MSNKPIFTTSEDNIDMFAGDTYYFIAKSWLGANKLSVIESTITDKWDIKRKASQTFGDKKNAEEYLRLNEKIFSVNDIVNIVNNSKNLDDLIKKLQ